MNEKHYAQMFAALDRIRRYDPPDRLRRISEREYGLDDANEAIEMAYENVIEEAKSGLRGVRKPKPATPKIPSKTEIMAEFDRTVQALKDAP